MEVGLVAAVPQWDRIVRVNQNTGETPMLPFLTFFLNRWASVQAVDEGRCGCGCAAMGVYEGFPVRSGSGAAGWKTRLPEYHCFARPSVRPPSSPSTPCCRVTSPSLPFTRIVRSRRDPFQPRRFRLIQHSRWTARGCRANLDWSAESSPSGIRPATIAPPSSAAMDRIPLPRGADAYPPMRPHLNRAAV
jgi:hypothetical protein